MVQVQASTSRGLPPRRPRVRLEGDERILTLLEGSIRRALTRRHRNYRVNVRSVGACGEVLVSIATARGELPLRFAGEELDAAFVASVITNTLDRFAA